MGSQAAWHSPSEELDSCFQVLLSLVVVVLLVAVPHGNALHPAFSHRGRGFFQRQAVPHGFIHLTVQCRIQNSLKAEVTVLFLRQRKESEAVTQAKLYYRVCPRSVCGAGSTRPSNVRQEVRGRPGVGVPSELSPGI